MTEEPLVSGSWVADAGVPLMHTLAGAIIALAETTGLDAFTLPYPHEAQRALDRTALACLRRGAAPPHSIPELVSWCRSRPIANWPLDLPPDAVGDTDRLLDPHSGLPTELCHEWYLKTRDSATRRYDRDIIHEAFTCCRESGEPDSYTSFRRLMVERPVRTSAEFFKERTDWQLAPVRDLLRLIFLPVPASHRGDDGEGYAVCGRCATLLIPLVGGGWWCERDACRRQGSAPIDRRLPVEETGGIVQLARPLRQFVTWPGRAEIELERTLVAAGLSVQMWPGYDAYDLRVTFPDGWVWAIDVKDWAHPGLLGANATAVRREPAYDEAFWVVPTHRIRDRPDYIDVYNRNRPDHAEDLILLTDRQVIDRARRRVRAGLGGKREDTPDA
ncbi:hypothetical protein [Embleya sp. NPDC050493]|uniref:pPIWI_RE_Y domain-containing protein n=1 Tax=Embleya sp. NPDC050493 TaxID=3363989 RepID=UPI0037AF0155